MSKKRPARAYELLRQVNPVLAAVSFVPGGAGRVAQECGVSRATVYRWIEFGRMHKAAYEKIKRLSELSGVPEEKLLKGNQATSQE